MNEPWSPERRGETKTRIDTAAETAAAELGADSVVIIALYHDGKEHLHIQDGGKCPMPFSDLYRGLAQAHDTVNERGEGYLS